MTPEIAPSSPGAPACAELRRKADALLSQYDTVMRDAASGHLGADQARREVNLTGALRELRAQFAAAAIAEAYVAEVEADAEARGFERGRGRGVRRQSAGRHSAQPASRWQQGVLTVVRVLVPVAAGTWAALGALGKPGLRHAARHHAVTALKAAWAAHPAGVVAGGTAVTGTAAALVTAAVVIVAPAAHRPQPWAGPSVPAPAASAWAAVPVTSSSPGAPVVSHGKTDARQAGQLGVIPLAPWSPASSPSLSPSPATAQAAATGALGADTTSADLSSGGPVTVTLSASGAPVQWSAWCDPGIDVTLSAAEGTASPGAPSYLTLSVPANEGGDPGAVCHVWPGGILIQVTLPGPAPSPSPSPADSAPTDLPSPSPS